MIFNNSEQKFLCIKFMTKICITRISGPDGPLILAVDLRNTPKGGAYGRTHTLLYIYRLLQYIYVKSIEYTIE